MWGKVTWFTAVPTICAFAFSLAVRAEPPKPEGAGEEPAFTQEFPEDVADFATTGTNPWLVLEPGYFLEYEGKEKKTKVRLLITVLDETKKVDNVETRIVEEKEWVGEELYEVSRNYLVISKRTNAVYYFGEDVDMYKKGKVVSHDGAWLAGVDGAKYGMLMPGTPLLGARYHQETAPGIAMDRGEIMSFSSKVTTPIGKFENVLKIEETTLLEPGHKEYKYYAKGIGMLRDGPNRLIKYGKPGMK